MPKSTKQFSFYGDILYAPRKTHSENQDNQAKFGIFTRFDLIDTLGLSQVLFCYQDLQYYNELRLWRDTSIRICSGQTEHQTAPD